MSRSLAAVLPLVLYAVYILVLQPRDVNPGDLDPQLQPQDFGSFDKVPVLNIANWRSKDASVRKSFAGDLFETFQCLGFVRITGVLDETALAEVDELYASAREFFAHDEALLRQIRPEPAPPGPSLGFIPQGTEHSDPNVAKADPMEAYHIGNPVRPAGTPSAPWELSAEIKARAGSDSKLQAVVASAVKLEANMAKTYARLQHLANELSQALAVSLGLDASYFDRWAEEHTSIMRSLHYPATAGSEHAAPRKAAHTDINFLTLIPVGREAAEPVNQGLEVYSPCARAFLPVLSGVGDVVVNSGDMLTHLTNGILNGGIHRVSQKASGSTSGGDRTDTKSSRFSFPFFYQPAFDVPIRPADVEHFPGFALSPLRRTIKSLRNGAEFWTKTHFLESAPGVVEALFGNRKPAVRLPEWQLQHLYGAGREWLAGDFLLWRLGLTGGGR